MEAPKSPYRELVDPDNAELLGTLHGESWAAFQEAWSDAVFFDLPQVQTELVKSLRMTGSVGGEHRRDIKEGIQGQRAPTMALGLQPVMNGHQDAPEARQSARTRLGLR